MDLALKYAYRNIMNDGGPFASIIVRDNSIVSIGTNCVTCTNDPTAHAEMIAIRKACHHEKTFSLKGCILYTTCEPCPMCLGALYWANIDKVYYHYNRNDASKLGFKNEFIYDELYKPLQERIIPVEHMKCKLYDPFKSWVNFKNKKQY